MIARRLLAPIVDLRDGESTTAALMFAYSFLAMTAYNIIRPITRSKFISDLGADNLPWVQLGAGLLIGLIMHAYAHVIALVPRRWAIPVTQAGCAVLLVGFWALFQRIRHGVGRALRSWADSRHPLNQPVLTLATNVSTRGTRSGSSVSSRRRSLGGASGRRSRRPSSSRVGTVNLLLVGAAVMLAVFCAGVSIVRREEKAGTSVPRPRRRASADPRRSGSSKDPDTCSSFRHHRVRCDRGGHLGAAAQTWRPNPRWARTPTRLRSSRPSDRDLSRGRILIQGAGPAVFTGCLGIGFALLILPVGLGATAVVMIQRGAVGTRIRTRPGHVASLHGRQDDARFVPAVPTAVKYRAKPFIDVTMDRFSKALGALMVLVLAKAVGVRF